VGGGRAPPLARRQGEKKRDGHKELCPVWSKTSEGTKVGQRPYRGGGGGHTKKKRVGTDSGNSVWPMKFRKDN